MGEVVFPVVGCHVLYLEEVTSTNDLALRMAEEGAPEGLVVIAERQTRGRGEEGKKWESPAGGLWTSIVLRPPHPASHAQIFALLGGVASAEAIRLMSGMEVFIRWPNDLVLKGKKLGGILCEAKVTGREIRHLVMGIGINVNQEEADFSLSLRALGTSLRLESGKIWDRRVLAEALYERLDFWYGSVKGSDLSPFFVRLSELSPGDRPKLSEFGQRLGVS